MSPSRNAPGSAATSDGVASKPSAPAACAAVTMSSLRILVGSMSTGATPYFSHSFEETCTSMGSATIISRAPRFSQIAWRARSVGVSGECEVILGVVVARRSAEFTRMSRDSSPLRAVTMSPGLSLRTAQPSHTACRSLLGRVNKVRFRAVLTP